MFLLLWRVFLLFVFVKHKTAYEMRIMDWSSDVCSSDLVGHGRTGREQFADRRRPDRSGIDAAEGQSFPDPAELRRDSPACGPGDRAARNRMIDIADQIGRAHV